MGVHARYVRHRDYDRLNHAFYFLSFLQFHAARLLGTGTPQAIDSYDNTTNIVNQAAHTHVNGDGPFRLANSGGALPTELSTTTDYWIGNTAAGTYQLFLTEADALANTSAVAFTDDGTGTQTLLQSANSRSIFDALLGGKTASQIVSITNIDNL